jgi:hypothetical protein
MSTLITVPLSGSAKRRADIQLWLDRSKIIPFTFDDEAHAYVVADRRILSTTQILNSLGYVNYDRVDEAVMEYKRQIGKLVHQACHFYDEDALDEEQEQIQHPAIHGRFEAYKKFRRETGYQPAINEGQFIADYGVPGYPMLYGMQFDSIGVCNGQDWLVDIKNAAGQPKRAWALQTASYAKGCERFLPIAAKNWVRVIVQLFEDGNYKLFSSMDANSKIFSPMDFPIWQACLAVATDQQNFRVAMKP